MIPQTYVCSGTGFSKPRASGDDPDDRVEVELHVRVNPARAGMILIAIHSPSLTSSKPRASGDDPYKDDATAQALA